jgi:hypothetical protein
MKITLPIQHDPWLLNGTETLYRLVKNIKGCHAEIHQDMVEIDIEEYETFLRTFADTIRSKQDQVIFCIKQDDKGGKRYVMKNYVLIQYGKAENRNVLKEKIYLDTDERLTEIFSNLEPGKRTCILCGRTFKKKVDNLKQAVHPFATKIRSLSGVRTMRENYDNICPLCYLVGTGEWLDEGIVYRCFLGPSGRTYSLVLLPFEMDLKKLNHAKETYITELNSINQQVTNICRTVSTNQGVRSMPTEGENTTILKFFEDFIEKIMKELKIEETEFDRLFEAVEETFCKQWSMLIIPSGKVKNVKYKPLILEDEILALFVELQRNGTKAYTDIIEKLSITKKEGGILFDNTNDLREKAAAFIIENNFRKFSRIFLPKKNEITFFGSITHLDKLVTSWRLRKMGLDQELENIKGAGEALAKLVKDHLSIMYAMDKAKNKPEFFRAFEQATKRLIGLDAKEREKLYPVPLENVADLIIESDENQWKMIRDALIVYTCINISRKRYSEDKKRGDST